MVFMEMIPMFVRGAVLVSDWIRALIVYHQPLGVVVHAIFPNVIPFWQMTPQLSVLNMEIAQELTIATVRWSLPGLNVNIQFAMESHPTLLHQSAWEEDRVSHQTFAVAVHHGVDQPVKLQIVTDFLQVRQVCALERGHASHQMFACVHQRGVEDIANCQYVTVFLPIHPLHVWGAGHVLVQIFAIAILHGVVQTVIFQSVMVLLQIQV
jgi:hypothetical protein